MNARTPRINRKTLLPLAIFVVAYAVRLVYLCQIRSSPHFEAPIMDAAYHDQWARRIAAGDWLGHEVFFRAPLYPYFLGLMYTLFGANYVLVRLVQFAIGAGTCVLLYFLGLRVAGASVGILAGLTAALYGPFIYFEGELLLPVFETFFTTALLLAVAWALNLSPRAPTYTLQDEAELTTRITERPGSLASRSRSVALLPWFVVGLFVGLFAITRPNILAFLPVLMAYVMRCLGLRTSWRANTAILFGTMICIFPVTVRNYIVGKDFVLISSQGGVNFYIGNNAASDGVTAVVPGTRATWWGGYRDTIAIAEKKARRKLRPSEVSAFWFGEALKFIRQRPRVWIQLTLRKSMLFWNAFEVSNNMQIYAAAWFSPLLGVLLWVRDSFSFPLGVIMPWAVVGLYLAVAQKKSAMTPVILFLLVYSATVIAFFVCARFRVPCVPVLILLAAYAINEFGSLIRRREWLNASVVLWAALIVAVFVNFDFYGTWRIDVAKAHQDLAAAYQEKGRLAEAEKEYRVALQYDPDTIENKLGLGICLLARGRPSEAQSLFADVLRQQRRRWEALVGMGDALAQQTRFEEAISYYKKAIRVDPLGTEAYLRLGDVFRKLGRDVEAEQVYSAGIQGVAGDESLRLALAQLYFDREKFDKVVPLCVQLIREGFYYTRARILLGSTYVNLQQFDKALPLAEQVLRLQPHNAEALVILGSCFLHDRKLDMAVEVLDRATKISRSSSAAWTNLAVALASKGEFRSAIGAAERALELDPHNIQARLVKAGSYYELGNRQKAAEECRRILQEGPYLPAARELLDKCRQQDATKRRQEQP
jgi:tetratricopeptide (TPR) repeat protein